MGLLTRSQAEYYSGRKSFTGDGSTTEFTVSKNPHAFPDHTAGILAGTIKVFIDGSLYPENTVGQTNPNYTFQWDTSVAPTNSAFLGWYLEFDSAPADAASIEVEITSDPNFSGLNVKKFGNYQFISLEDIINNFMIAYVGEGKVINKVHRTDVQFHAMRAIQEMSFDTFKSTKAQEIEVPATLTMPLPHDYVNYVKLVMKDSTGIEHTLHPISKSSNPFNPKQNSDGSYNFDPDDDGVFEENVDTDLIPEHQSDTWAGYKSYNPAENRTTYEEDTYWPALGERYGLNPQYAQTNGSFYIDELKGLIHFSSNLSGSTITLKYISDGLGTDEEMIVHKFAEEAMYKWIVCGIASTKVGVPEYAIQRYKREKKMATRNAKLRLSNLKIEELTQILRGKSKWIKH